MLFSTVAVPAYNPTHSAQVSFTPHPCQHLLVLVFPDDSYSNRREVINAIESCPPFTQGSSSVEYFFCLSL